MSPSYVCLNVRGNKHEKDWPVLIPLQLVEQWIRLIFSTVFEKKEWTENPRNDEEFISVVCQLDLTMKCDVARHKHHKEKFE